MQFFNTNKSKKPQLAFENRIHWHNKTNKNTTQYYVCDKKSSGCHGSCTVSPGKTSIFKKVQHTCIQLSDEEIDRMVIITSLTTT